MSDSRLFPTEVGLGPVVVMSLGADRLDDVCDDCAANAMSGAVHPAGASCSACTCVACDPGVVVSAPAPATPTLESVADRGRLGIVRLEPSAEAVETLRRVGVSEPLELAGAFTPTVPTPAATWSMEVYSAAAEVQLYAWLQMTRAPSEEARDPRRRIAPRATASRGTWEQLHALYQEQAEWLLMGMTYGPRPGR